MPAIKTVIYLDVLLLVNFLVAYFLLQAAGLLSSQHAAFSRMVCASGIASLSALILFAPELSYPAQILYKILTACAVVGVAFGLQGLRRFVTAVCWYAALNILLAGLCIAVILRTGTPLLQTANLTVYLRISPVVLLLLSAASCGAVWLVLHFSGSTPQTTRTIGIEFELCGAPVRLRATLDTGCHLKDPVTCLPVLLISWPAAKGRLPGGVNAFLGQWFQGLHPSTPPVGASLRVIPCNTAAQHALLPGFAVADISTITETGMQ
ncbi:MAG: sigma-E processing peptidase SpoIIGA, partial [Gemmiger qucibialis]